MKCRKHPVDPSSAVGVCATCLRERLFALIAAQAQAEALGHARPCADDDRRKPDDPPQQQQQQPPPRRPPQHPAFPRSVSPYISRRKSDAGGGRHQRFYSTPQVGPAYRYSDAAGGFVPSEPRKKKKRGRFSLFASLFGKSRSEKFDWESDPRFSSNSDPALFRHRDSCRATPSWWSSSSASSSSSWFSFLLHRRGKGRPPVGGFPAEEEAVSAFDARRPRPVSNRGMSPERGDEESDDEDRENRSPPGSGYASESSRGRRRTPPAGPALRGPRPGLQSRNVSGLSFCLSPLVRPSPARQWNNHHHPHLPKCGLQHPDAGYSGEIRAPGHPHPHLSTAASYLGNRSRKLADFGRANPNR
ncbi:uncharacterized protein LOC130139833 [Syzygium oleosum]|uniref:uncharacterized protein LOC130139833 n=1 Tax=Syzygium oleosum TaxID=219896 RepID=UPI0024B9C9B8|nr:uncharacterized protein LOC130139833 [Syzygium oleosum]